MTHKFTVRQALPGLNEYTKSLNCHRMSGAKVKKVTEEYILWDIKSQLGKLKITRPVILHFTWVEPSRKRDLDNVAFAKKFIQDALVTAGVLQNDGWKHVVGFTDSFLVDKKNPRVEVMIEEIEL